jgi:hypothetical protein
VGGWIGLLSRPVLDALQDRDRPRYEFSGKGAILGSVSSFLVVFAFAPMRTDRSALVLIFIAGAMFYYAIGKCGCLFLGCCRAAESRTLRAALPLVEVAWALVLCAIALLALPVPLVRMPLIPAIAAAALALRVYSRWARGSGLAASLMKLDSVALECFIAFTTIVSLRAI